MSAPPIISTQEITKGYAEHPLFSGLSLTIHEQERLALIGANGSGKSTLLKILANIEEVDSGAVRMRKGLRCAYVAQAESFAAERSVGDILEESLHALDLEPAELARRRGLYLRSTGFNDDTILIGTLSGGWKKRLAIACALALEPDCLLLDEPTNHLDIDSILWLEEHLASLQCAIVFVSHDRYFIERLATRVLEIGPQYPDHSLLCEGGYADYIERREETLEQLQQQRKSLANKVRREVEWLRQGVKARTTKSRSRINEAHKLIDQLRTSPTGDEKRPDLQFSSTQRKTKELLKAEEIAQALGGKELFSHLSLVLSPGTRLAIVGPNGSGKTTLIRTLLGEMQPSAGRVVRAPNLRVACIEQSRTQLRDDLRLKEFLCPHGDSVVFRGESLHVAAWASRFLFTHNHLSTTLGSLSGGERARALLAKSMVEECDLLLFDEPTNDLDIATLENLEESFESFPGAIVLITHDRYLLERTASSVLGLRDGHALIYGSYSQWESAQKDTPQPSRSKKEPSQVETKKAPPTKLSYKDARELATIEEQIAKAEERVASIQSELASEHNATNSSKLSDLCESLRIEQLEVERLYERWQQLETMQKALIK